MEKFITSNFEIYKLQFLHIVSVPIELDNLFNTKS
jgi:hypothetical protein